MRTGSGSSDHGHIRLVREWDGDSPAALGVTEGQIRYNVRQIVDAVLTPAEKALYLANIRKKGGRHRA